MKISLNTILAIAIIALVALIGIGYMRDCKLKEDLERAKVNELAWISERDSLKNKSIEFEYTINELKNSGDSLTKEMMKVKKELGVKDKQIEYLSYLASHAVIKDTVRLRDTLFVEGAKLDTTINNRWYRISLGLDYPSTIGVGVSVPSEKYIVASTKKILLNPTGCWFKNIFKKKSNIVEVEVVEKNPYIISDKQKFIEIIK